MTSTKKAGYTPGKWAVHPRLDSRIRRAGIRGTLPWHIVPEGHTGRPIGFATDTNRDLATYSQEICTLSFGHRSDEEIWANANLIVQAPAMVEALELLYAHSKEFHDVIDDGEIHPDCGWCAAKAVLDRLRDAGVIA